jgi:hypothetical protein
VVLQFEGKFGIGWQAALDAGKVFNAKDACEKLGKSADELDGMWGACKKAGNMIKFGGGFYCGEIQKDMYVFNGFFMVPFSSSPFKESFPSKSFNFYSQPVLSMKAPVSYMNPFAADDAQQVRGRWLLHLLLRDRVGRGRCVLGGLPRQGSFAVYLRKTTKQKTPDEWTWRVVWVGVCSFCVLLPYRP